MREAPAVAAVEEQYGDRVDIIGVAGRDDIDTVNRFIDGRGVAEFEHVYDETGDIWATFGVVSQPTFVFITADGEAEVVFGGQGEESLTERLESLLAAA